MFEWIFSTFWPKMSVLGQNTFGSCYLCATFGKNQSRNAIVRVQTDRQTDRQTARQTDTVTESN